MMLKSEISFVYEAKNGEVTRRSLSNYTIKRNERGIFLTGNDSLRGGAIRRFLRNQILATSKLDNNKDECDHCGCQYHDNKNFVINEKIPVTFCLVGAYEAAMKGATVRSLA